MVTCPSAVPAPQRGQPRQVLGSPGLTHLASNPRGWLSPAAAFRGLSLGGTGMGSPGCAVQVTCLFRTLRGLKRYPPH